MSEQDAIQEQLAAQDTSETLPVGTWHTPPAKKQTQQTTSRPMAHDHLQKATQIAPAKLSYEERQQFLRQMAADEKKDAFKATIRRVLFTLGTLAACLALTLGVRALAAKTGKDLPFADFAKHTAAKSEVLEQTMPQGLTLDPLVLAKKERNSAWNLMLPNAEHPLPADYVPRLAQVVDIDATSGYQFDSRAVDALRQMLADCTKAGLRPMIISAYRSHERQTMLFESMQKDYMSQGKTEKEAYDITKSIRQIPGTSEHESGLATDITCVYQPDLEPTFENTPEFKWYYEHCADYGFILRYPKDKQDITGIMYEPWHYRYVGVEDAKKIMEQGVCLEEYLS
ncbi:MAG: M15 family metallopeptidase [Ruthenibacterium sp.]